MLTQNGASHNGNGLHAQALHPAIDVTPSTPRPKWRDQHPLYVEHIEWVDHEGISHGLTIRSDDLQGLLADLRLVKSMIRQARKHAAEHAPQQAATPEPEASQPDVLPCKIHGVDMARRYSKRTNASYFSHRMPDNSLCYGREKKA